MSGTAIEAFKRLAASSRLEFKRTLSRSQDVDGDEVLAVQFDGARTTARATFYDYHHVHGILEVLVLDEEGKFLATKHLTGPDEPAVEAAWNEMLELIAHREGKEPVRTDTRK